MARRTVSGSPRRRTYVTGESAPELSDSFRPIPLGLDENGDSDEQIRAFAVNIRNLSESPVYVSEGREGDAAVIDRFGNYTIWETNGISSVNLRGENGGEKVELRVLEAHNDFGIRDKIDAFVRAVSHFFSSNKQETVITGAETVINTNVQSSDVEFDTNIQSADGVTFDTNIQSSDVSLDTSITDVTDGVTVDTRLSDIGNIGELDVNLSAQSVDSIDADISAQSVGNISTVDRTSRHIVRRLWGSGRISYIDSDGNVQTNEEYWTLYDSAPFDGQITNYSVRFMAHESQGYDTTKGVGNALHRMGVALQLNRGDGWRTVSPREMITPELAKKYGRDTEEVNLIRYGRKFESKWKVEPRQPYEFREGDGIRFIIRGFADDFPVGSDGGADDPSAEGDYFPTPGDDWPYRNEMTVNIHEKDL